MELSASASDGTKNSDIVPSANDGTAGTRGNDGWGGLNLVKHERNQGEKKIGIGTVSGDLSGDFDQGKVDIYHNGTIVEGPDVSNNVYTSIFLKYRIGEDVPWSNGLTFESHGTWLEIYFVKKYEFSVTSYDSQGTNSSIENFSIYYECSGTIACDRVYYRFGKEKLGGRDIKFVIYLITSPKSAKCINHEGSII